jgi:uncharacterized protein (DUF433 family)
MDQRKTKQPKTKSKGTKRKPRAVKETRTVYAVTPRPRITETEHPHIIKVAGVRGGRPITRGSYTSVRTIVEITYRLKQTPEEIAESYNGLTLAQVFDALSYYHDHKEEIDENIAANDQIDEQFAERARLRKLEQEKTTEANG